MPNANNLTAPASLRAFIGADVATIEQVRALSAWHKRHSVRDAGWAERGGAEGRDWAAGILASLDPSAVHVPSPELSAEGAAAMSGVVAYEKCPVDDGAWDADAAVASLRKWASSDGSGAKDRIDWSKYAGGFAWYDSGDVKNFGAYKLPHHLVRDGKLYTSKRGVAAAIAALHGARGGVKDIPEADRAAVLAHLEKHRREWADADKKEARERADSLSLKAYELTSTRLLADDMPAPGERDADGYYTRTWVQVAKIGKYKGHAAGPFEFTSEIFDEMVANHAANPNGIVPFDYEHSSESQDSSVYQHGAPAMGWILDLENRSDAGLWALVGWVDLECIGYIRGHKYKFCSPAVVFDATDPESGKNMGPVLVSAAVTNRPFLQGMRSLAARARETAMAASAALRGGAERVHIMAFPTDGDMDSHEDVVECLRGVLGMRELSSEAEVLAEFAKLEALIASDPEGIDAQNVAQLINTLRWSFRLPSLTSAADVIAEVRKGLAQGDADESESPTAASAASATARTSGPTNDLKGPVTMSNITTEQHEALLKAHEELKAAHSKALSAHGDFCAKCAEKLGLPKESGPEKILEKMSAIAESHKKMSDESEMRAKAEAESDVDKAAAGMKADATKKAALRDLRMSNKPLFVSLYGEHLVAAPAAAPPPAPPPAPAEFVTPSFGFDAHTMALTHQVAAPGGANPGAIPLADARKAAADANAKIHEAALALMRSEPQTYGQDYAQAVKAASRAATT